MINIGADEGCIDPGEVAKDDEIDLSTAENTLPGKYSLTARIWFCNYLYFMINIGGDERGEEVAKDNNLDPSTAENTGWIQFDRQGSN